MTVFSIHTVDNPVSPRDCWGVFVHERRMSDKTFYVEQRVFGPANLLDCIRTRDSRVNAERHGEPATC